jgi:hypothetical protein
MSHFENDPDRGKGAVEQDRPSQETNTSLQGQLPHRHENSAVKQQDTDFPEPGETPEHSGEPRAPGLLDRDQGCEKRERGGNPAGQAQDQQPGQQQKQNQGGNKDDPLAA